MHGSRGLPPFAEEFIQAHPPLRAVVRAFHCWLKSTQRPLRQLAQGEIEVFLLRFGGKKTTSRRLNRSRALRYFDWLHSRDLLSFDPRCAWPRSNFPLPDPAIRFVESLVPITRASTVNGYRTALRQFHIWLDSRSVTLASLDRDTIASWLQWLHARGLHSSSRTHAIQQVRMYLRWLEEHGVLAHPADTLLRPVDLPKLPQYLPRPLPPDLDATLQAHLMRSESMYKLGLLLMRRTGLRIGELINLPYSCIRTNPKGERFLKVPLGKLDNERLVPLDKRTLKTLNKLRRMGKHPRAFLIERAPGEPARYAEFREALRIASAGLRDAEPITSHRLRHTYATAMLAGGMSLIGVMRLLGHKDYRMTLRYAAITDETVLAEFAAALDRNKHRYETPRILPPPLHPDPAKQLSDLAHQLLARAQDDDLDRVKARNLARRLRRLASEVRRLQKRSQ